MRKDHPNLVFDAEMQARFALSKELLEESFPFSELTRHKPNTCIFPNLATGNIAYKLRQSFEVAKALGPMPMEIKKPAHVLQIGGIVREIVNMVTLASVDFQTKKLTEPSNNASITTH